LGFELGRGRQGVGFVFFKLGPGQFIANDVVAQVNALIANKDRGACNELFNLVLVLATKRAVQAFVASGAFSISHQGVLSTV
jgi:lipid-binding SYLF domain-containing protein